MKFRFLIILLFPLLSFAQKDSTIAQKPVAATTPLITLKDLQEYHDYLRKSFSYDAYINLKPEAVLQELWNWKMKQKL